MNTLKILKRKKINFFFLVFFFAAFLKSLNYNLKMNKCKSFILEYSLFYLLIWILYKTMQCVCLCSDVKFEFSSKHQEVYMIYKGCVDSLKVRCRKWNHHCVSFTSHLYPWEKYESIFLQNKLVDSQSKRTKTLNSDLKRSVWRIHGTLCTISVTPSEKWGWFYTHEFTTLIKLLVYAV